MIPARLYPLTFRRIFGVRAAISAAFSRTVASAARYASPSRVRSSSFCSNSVGVRGVKREREPSERTAVSECT